MLKQKPFQDFLNIKKFFPFFKNNKVIYFDNGATTQKLKSVIDASNHYYLKDCANLHSSDCFLAFNALSEYKKCKKSIAKFLNCNDNELFFSFGTTLILNQFVFSLEPLLKENDVVLLSYFEHSSNFFPWVKLQERKKIKIFYLPYKEDFSVDYQKLKTIIQNNKIKVISLALVNNNTSEKIDILKIKSFLDKKEKTFIILDAAQAIAHTKINLNLLDIDFLAFSGHKIYGPTGIGVGYINQKTFKEYQLDPVIYGGGAVSWFDDELNYQLKPFPYSFEPGTLNIQAIYGLRQAIEFVDLFGIEKISKYEKMLQKYAISKLKNFKNIIIYNQNIEGSIVLINVNNVFSQDVASYLSYKKICVRSGDHCAKLLKNVIDIKNTIRISFAIYNNKEEIDKLILEIKNGGDFLGGFFR